MGRLTGWFYGIVERVGLGWVLIALGVILLLNPLYIGALHLTEPNWYRYDAAEVRFEDGLIAGPGSSALADDDAACLDKAYRNCVLEYHVITDGEVAVPEAFAHENGGYGHRYVWWEGEFYRTATEERNGTTYLTVEPLDRETALGYISTPLSDAPKPVRKAITGGTVTTREPIPTAGELVRDPQTGTLYVLYTEASHSLGSDALAQAKSTGRIIKSGLMVLLGVVGLAAILKGQRIRIE